MAVTALTQRLVPGFRGGITLRGDARPVVYGVAKARVAGVSPDDHTALAGSLGNRRDAAQATQSSVVSSPECIPSLREQRGERDPSDTWQGVEDHGVTLLVALPRRRLLAVSCRGLAERAEQAIELGPRLHELAVDQPDAIDQGPNVRRRGVGRAGRDRDRRGTQRCEHARRIGLANAIVLQHAHDRALAHAGGFVRRRHDRPKVEQPRRRDIALDREHLRKVAPQLLSHAVGEARAFGREVFRDARPLTQFDHRRVGDGELSEGVSIRSQRRRHGLGVAAVVLGACHREAITEAVELLRVDRVHVETALEQRLDDRAMRHLDADRDPAWHCAGRCDQPFAHLVETFAAVREEPVAEPLADGVGQPNVVLLRCPIDTGVEPRLLHVFLQAVKRACTTAVDPCTGAPTDAGRGLPTGPQVVATRRGTGPPQVLKPLGMAQGAIGCSRRGGSDPGDRLIRVSGLEAPSGRCSCYVPLRFTSQPQRPDTSIGVRGRGRKGTGARPASQPSGARTDVGDTPWLGSGRGSDTDGLAGGWAAKEGRRRMVCERSASPAEQADQAVAAPHVGNGRKTSQIQ